MPEKLTDDAKRSLIDAVDLVALIGEDHAVRREGAHYAVCCPWHHENTPSCVIYDDQHFHCFGCGAHGDAITYLQEQRGLDWDAAIAEMRRRAGPGFEPSAPAPPKTRAKSQDRAEWTPIVPVPDYAPRNPPSHRHYGEPQELWPYHDSDGRLLGYVARYHSNSHGKVTPAWTWCRGMVKGEDTQMWRQRRWAKPYPILGLYDLAQRPADTVLIVEGEKTRTWAAEHVKDMVAITPCGGHQNWKHSDWAPLRGRRVVVWADADLDPGKGPAAWLALAQYLHEHQAATVLIADYRRITALLGTDRYPDDWHEIAATEVAAAKAEKRKVDFAPILADRGLTLPPDGWDLADLGPDPTEQHLAQVRIIIAQAEEWLPPHAGRAAVSAAVDSPADDGLTTGIAIQALQALAADEDDDRQQLLDQQLAQLPLTEADLSARLVSRYGDSFRFDATSNRWYVWAGSHWRVDVDGQMGRWALATVAALHREAQYSPPHRAKKDYHIEATKSHRRKIREGMIADAKIFPDITIRSRRYFDCDDWLLATPIGTLDLRTMTLRKSLREDLITVCTAAEWRGLDITHPMLDRVIHQLTNGDHEFAEILCQVMGSALIGGNQRERVHVFTGDTNTGKTTLIEGIMAALGDQVASATEMDTFTVSRTEKIRSDIARLDGPRLVYADDTRDGIVLDDGILKRLTGGGHMVTRFLFGNEFSFRPKFTPYLLMNAEPTIRASTAIARRLVRLHFAHTVPESDRDPVVKATMKDVATTGPAILAWLARGAAMHIERSGAIPARFAALATSTLAASDPLATFLSDWLEWRSDGWATAKDIRECYERDFCEPDGLHPVSGQHLNRQLRELGASQRVDKIDNKSVKVWTGVTLRHNVRLRQPQETFLPVTESTEKFETSRIHDETLTARVRARAVSNSSSCAPLKEKVVDSVTGRNDPQDRLDDEPPF